MNTPKSQAQQLLQDSLVHLRKACKNGLGLWVIELEELIELAALFEWKQLLQDALDYTAQEAKFDNMLTGALTNFSSDTERCEQQRNKLLTVPSISQLKEKHPTYKSEEVWTKIVTYSPFLSNLPTKPFSKKEIQQLNQMQCRELACAHLVLHQFDQAAQVEPYLTHKSAYFDYVMVKVIELHRANRWKEALQEYREYFQKEAAVSVPFTLLFAKGFLCLKPWDIYPYSDNEYDY